MSFKQFVSNIEGFKEKYQDNISKDSFFGFPLAPVLSAEKKLLTGGGKNIAYFSMEYGLGPSIYQSFLSKKAPHPDNQTKPHQIISNIDGQSPHYVRLNETLDIPIYSGGLGVLAGDTMKSMADDHFSVAGIGILWNKGYFRQTLDVDGGQSAELLHWEPGAYPGLIPLKNIITLDTKEGLLHLRLWKYYVYSYDQTSACPIILLDSNLPENADYLQILTDQLYKSEHVWWNIFQRVILGVGGMKALAALNYHIDYYHLNEGHAAFALVEKYVGLKCKEQMKNYRKKFVYTCHTPVAAGHDRYCVDDLSKILKDDYLHAAKDFGLESPGSDLVNLTDICLSHCDNVSAVAQKHGEIMRVQFTEHQFKVKAITNGIHIHTWLTDNFRNLFNRYSSELGDWLKFPEHLSNITRLKDNEQFRVDLFGAHQANKKDLLKLLKPLAFDTNTLTIGWARRMTGYKRPSLLLRDIKALVKLAENAGPIQIIFAGKAHPNDETGKENVNEILREVGRLDQHNDVLKVFVIENYNTYLGKLLTSSVDIWLNNPLPPFEASGTSGMKSILNGVLQLSTLDGWVVEAAQDNIGWIFGYQHSSDEVGEELELRMEEDSKALYRVLKQVMQSYYQMNKQGRIDAGSEWIDKMIQCVSKSAFFNTQRMVEEYNKQMWTESAMEASA